MWTFYFFFALYSIVVLRFFFPDLYSEVLLPVARWSLWHVKEKFRRAVPWVIQKSIVLWNSPGKILIFIFIDFPTKILIGIVSVLSKIPLGIKKLLTVIWQPDSEEKEQKKDVLEEIRNYIQGCGLGPPFSKMEIKHLFYIGHYHHFERPALPGIIEEALGAYIIRQELPYWMKLFVEQYKNDRSLETLCLPLRPKIRYSMVINWLKKNPRKISTVDDFKKLPWWMQALTHGYCREKVDTICLMERCFKKAVPEKKETGIQT